MVLLRPTIIQATKKYTNIYDKTCSPISLLILSIKNLIEQQTTITIRPDPPQGAGLASVVCGSSSGNTPDCKEGAMFFTCNQVCCQRPLGPESSLGESTPVDFMTSRVFLRSY